MIAIIGSKGFIGKNLVEYFTKQKISFHEYSSKLDNLIDENLFLKSNFQLPENCETVIYLCQSPNYRLFPEKYNELIKINSLLPFEIARLAIKAGAKRFIYFSTGSVYSPSLDALSEDAAFNRESSYPLSKIHGEENLKILANDIEVCCLRPFGVYGPGQQGMLVPNLISNVRNRNEIFIDKVSNEAEPDGLNISLSYIGDVVANIGKLVEKKKLPLSLNLASENAYSIKDIVEEISKQLGIEPNYIIRETFRTGNLVADCSRLNDQLVPDTTSLSAGISQVLKGE